MIEVVQQPDQSRDAHVIPSEQLDPVAEALGFGHRADPSCWCQPVLNLEDLVTRGRVYRHKKES